MIKLKKSNVSTKFRRSGFLLFTYSSPEQDINVCFYSVLCFPVLVQSLRRVDILLKDSQKSVWDLCFNARF